MYKNRYNKIMLRIYNTLSRKIEEFVPIKPSKVGMYTCGPTVYDYQHIGNFRTMVLSDILRRTLEYNQYEVKSVRNITDIDDKIIKNASEKGIPIGEFSKEYTKIFFEDLEKLNILPVGVVTYATEYIPKMIVYIKDLIDKKFAYVEPDGSVYFDIKKFKDYGKLANLDNQKLKTGMRVLSDEYTKDNVQDFALWKATKEGEIQSYDSPWGKGRPGWHIECSVMSQDNLGETLDVHVGGRDLIFPHHENEIAQSEAKTGKKFVNFWVHGEFLNVDSGKMSKSLKNFYTIKDIEAKGFDPLALRYFYLTAHYRTVLNFTWEALESAQNAIRNLKLKIQKLKSISESDLQRGQIGCAGYENDFLEAVNSDLNMPQALAVLWKLVDDPEMPARAILTSLMRFDKVLGLRLDSLTEIGGTLQVSDLPEDIRKLIDEREQLRSEKKFSQADKVREKLEKKGYNLKDTPDGVKLYKN